jgi:hypothetical protein
MILAKAAARSDSHLGHIDMLIANREVTKPHSERASAPSTTFGKVG